MHLNIILTLNSFSYIGSLCVMLFILAYYRKAVLPKPKNLSARETVEMESGAKPVVAFKLLSRDAKVFKTHYLFV